TRSQEPTTDLLRTQPLQVQLVDRQHLRRQPLKWILDHRSHLLPDVLLVSPDDVRREQHLATGLGVAPVRVLRPDPVHAALARREPVESLWVCHPRILPGVPGAPRFAPRGTRPRPAVPQAASWSTPLEVLPGPPAVPLLPGGPPCGI